MTRVHDMGGRFGDGAVLPDSEDAPVFSEEWHGRALALTLAVGALGQWNLDISRHSRERLSPKNYARFSYYEKWISALADLMVEKGVVTQDELHHGRSAAESPLAAKCFQPGSVAPALAKGGPADRPGPDPRFAIGQSVRANHRAANAKVQGGHTRLPAYSAGCVGRIIAQHGCHVFPDSNAHGIGEDPKPLYSVAFKAVDLWGQAEHPNDEVVLDLWEPYLSEADG